MKDDCPDQSSINFVTYNVRGLDSKLDDPDFISFVSQYDIICLTETFATSKPESNTFKEHNMYIAKAKKLSHQGRYSGGVLMLIRKGLNTYVENIVTEVDNVIILKIKNSLFGTIKDILLIGAYIPPHDSNYWNSSVNGFGWELLEKCMLDLEYPVDDLLMLV